MELTNTTFAERPVPWRRKGIDVTEAKTAADALSMAGLDWSVSLHPVEAVVDDRRIELPDRFATIRDTDDLVLGLVGKDYNLLQNKDVFTFADNLVDSGEALYDTAGDLRGGRWIWLTMKLPKGVLIGGEDPHDMYVLFSSSHDGSRAVTASLIPMRLKCKNQVNMAIRNAVRKWSVRHTTTVNARIEEAREALMLSFDYMDKFNTLATDLMSMSFSEVEFERFVDELLPDRPKKADVAATLRALFVDSPTLDNVRGTAWGAFNAVSEYFSWVRNPETPDSQLIGDWTGVGLRMRDRALDLLVAA